MVKNCGQPIHEQVAVRSVMEQIYDLLRNTNNEEVRKKILFILATWVYAFRNETKYRAVQVSFYFLFPRSYSYYKHQLKKNYLCSFPNNSDINFN